MRRRIYKVIMWKDWDPEVQKYPGEPGNADRKFGDDNEDSEVSKLGFRG